jgi:hypothetical protein
MKRVPSVVVAELIRLCEALEVCREHTANTVNFDNPATVNQDRNIKNKKKNLLTVEVIL